MSKKRRNSVKGRSAKPTTLHGHDGLMDIAGAEVADPFEPTKSIAVIRNVAAPLDNLYSRHRIDAAQFAAGQRYKRLFDDAAIGGARAIDYGREHVDGGIREQVSVKALEAGRELARLGAVLGKRGAHLMHLVVGEELPLGQAVKRVVTGINPLQGQGYVVCRLVEALDALVDHWGLIAISTGSRRGIRVSAETVTGPQSEWAVGRFGDWVDVARKTVA